MTRLCNCCINRFTSLCKNLFNLLEFFSEAFRCQVKMMHMASKSEYLNTTYYSARSTWTKQQHSATGWQMAGLRDNVRSVVLVFKKFYVKLTYCIKYFLELSLMLNNLRIKSYIWKTTATTLFVYVQVLRTVFSTTF